MDYKKIIKKVKDNKGDIGVVLFAIVGVIIIFYLSFYDNLPDFLRILHPYPH